MELAGGWTIGRLVECELAELDRVLEEFVARDYKPIRDVVATLVARMRGTLRRLIDIGVGYLSLNRGVPTLSGGDSQRVKMATAARLRLRRSHLHSGRADRGAPSAGHRSSHHHAPSPARPRQLGPRRRARPHDPAVIRAAYWIVDIGPRAGDGGGEVVFPAARQPGSPAAPGSRQPPGSGRGRRVAGSGSTVPRVAGSGPSVRVTGGPCAASAPPAGRFPRCACAHTPARVIPRSVARSRCREVAGRRWSRPVRRTRLHPGLLAC